MKKLTRSTVGAFMAMACILALALVFLIEYEREIDRLQKKLARNCPTESVEGYKKAETHEYYNRVCIIYTDDKRKPVKMVCQYYNNSAKEAKM